MTHVAIDDRVRLATVCGSTTSTGNEWLANVANWLIAKPLAILGPGPARARRPVDPAPADRPAGARGPRTACCPAGWPVRQRRREPDQARPGARPAAADPPGAAGRDHGLLLKSITTGVIFAIVGIMVDRRARLQHRAADRQRRHRRRRARLRRAEPGQGLPVRHLHDLRGPVRRRRLVDVGEASGTVEAVGLRVTRLRDVNGTVWYVRNGEILRVGNMSQNWARTVLDIPRRPRRGPGPGAAACSARSPTTCGRTRSSST